MTHVVIVQDAVIDSPPRGILHGSLTNQIAIHFSVINLFVHFFLYLIRSYPNLYLVPCTTATDQSARYYIFFTVCCENTTLIGQSGPTGMQLKIVIQC